MTKLQIQNLLAYKTLVSLCCDL